ncbi:glycogen debranching protein GlgX [Dactylosporangium fulvum]|uniref:Alpha-amylase family glycosyl hydrolase n=1 Tax=Dactylosporangium fulvum TaxID=53359 RepID=A0ABY5VPY9_9ACTN|nr:alpha-amylase family glycosyl hydrolase [Dactylosporangium fulvum]UWP79833.1 alpha-amylase family glycosyl hydrolase [Dactylosporangium fulvum]
MNLQPPETALLPQQGRAAEQALLAPLSAQQAVTTRIAEARRRASAQRGTPRLLPGATWNGSGTTFRLWSSAATRVDVTVVTPCGAVDTPMQRAGAGWWHAELTGAPPGTRYGFRVAGPAGPGHRFDPSVVLLDPYAHGVEADTSGRPVGVVTDPRGIGPRPPRPGHSWSDTVVYEAHVLGLSVLHPDVPAELRGTYLGACHPAVLAHLHRLGVTAIELLPVAAFVDEPRLRAAGRFNYWGYNPVAFAAPHVPYSAGRTAQAALCEFRTMVDTFHEAGIEVILDVVHNHTGEGEADLPPLSLRGVDNAAYYRLSDADPDRYDDVTGCGNTLDVRRPAAVELIRWSLRWWTEVCGVDGFRFDLATTLGRTGPHGAYDPDAPLLRELLTDPVLAGVKLIAEPWDCAGYALGAFPTGWAEWNDRYRGDVRDYWRGRTGRGALATRLAGSSDVFGERGAIASLNFVTAHDGFTLADLVSYNTKHNTGNGEGNRDGTDDNRSWNCGVEGPSDQADVLRLRDRQARNLIGTLLVSRGVPMLVAGDEGGRSQRGNNNAYSATSPDQWAVRWTELDQRLVDFCAAASDLRRRLPQLRAPGHPHAEDVTWAAPDGGPVHDWQANAPLAMILHGPNRDVAVLTNPRPHPVEFVLPGRWSVVLSSAHDDPGAAAAAGLTLDAHTITVALHEHAG